MERAAICGNAGGLSRIQFEMILGTRSYAIDGRNPARPCIRKMWGDAKGACLGLCISSGTPSSRQEDRPMLVIWGGGRG